MNNARVKHFKLADQLIGQRLPTNHGGHAGRALEDLLESMGVEINRSKGCDSLVYGVEVKSRDLDATSPQTVATMPPEDIATLAYKDSVVCEKFQQQFRVYTRNGVIVDARIHDFSVPHIQEKLETAYNNAQGQFRLGTVGDYVYGSEYGYFERTNPDSRSYSFRIHVGAFEKLEAMAASTFKNLFEEITQ